jgi:hypothetical protein
MIESTKIEFRYRRISQLDDLTDLVAILFPGNRNQQHAAARILIALKHAKRIVPSLGFLESEHGLSRRTLERTRAKLARLGVVEHVTWMNSRHGGQQGWKLSSRMSGALRSLADKVDAWQKDDTLGRQEKDDMLARLLRP